MEKRSSSKDQWYQVGNINEVNSPGLLIYPDRIEKNIQKMIETIGNVNLLRPHVKTHKMPEIIKLQMNRGINKFKCATIAETEMVARCTAADILLAMQPVGPNLKRFFQLKQKYPDTLISCIADNELTISQLSKIALETGLETHVWLDINNGMNRTGIESGDKAFNLYKLISRSPMLKAEGLHVYDGHIHDSDILIRHKKCNDAYLPAQRLIDDLNEAGMGPVRVVAGGTPSFPVHALRRDVECSPGTLLLWDYKSDSSFADMEYLYAAVLVMRIVSKPGKDLLCLDLGHKAVAPEMPHPRISIMGLEECEYISQSEEHLVIKTHEADKYITGDVLYGIPYHICPTVDRYDTVTVIRNNKADGLWTVEARKRKITI
jgi:D-serine deaminase-like pyridoxal phosphate-dependent protein